MSKKIKQRQKDHAEIVNFFTNFQKVVKQSGPYAAASYGLIASILIFTYLGWVFDNKNDSSPKAVVFGLLFGVLVGFYQLLKVFRKSLD